MGSSLVAKVSYGWVSPVGRALEIRNVTLTPLGRNRAVSWMIVGLGAAIQRGGQGIWFRVNSYIETDVPLNSTYVPEGSAKRETRSRLAATKDATSRPATLQVTDCTRRAPMCEIM